MTNYCLEPDVGGYYDDTFLPVGWRFKWTAPNNARFLAVSPEKLAFDSRTELMKYLRRYALERRAGGPPLVYPVALDKEARMLRRQFSVSDSSEAASFAREAVVVLPKLGQLLPSLADFDGRIQLFSCDASEPAEREAGRADNIAQILAELSKQSAENQSRRDNESESEEAADSDEDGSNGKSAARSLRARRHPNYEEPSIDEDFTGVGGRKPERRNGGTEENPTSGNQSAGAEEVPYRHRERGRFTDAETATLERYFFTNPYPKKEETDEISEALKVSVRKVRVWYQNKRNKTDDGKMRCFIARNNLTDRAESRSDSSDDEEDEEECDDVDVDNDDHEDDEDDRQDCDNCGKVFKTRMMCKQHYRRANCFSQEESLRLRLIPPGVCGLPTGGGYSLHRLSHPW